MKKYLLLALMLFCSSTAHADITLGLIAPITGSNAIYGEQLRHGAMQAVDDLNAAGGVKGEKLILRVIDDACDPKQAVVAANQLASAGVKYVVGHYCSGSALAASKIYQDEGMLMVTPAATNPRLTDEAKDLIFRVCGRDDRQGTVIGNTILQKFPTQKLAIVHDNSAYGRGLAEQVQATVEAGGQYPSLLDTYKAGERDYSALVSKLKRAGIGTLFIGGYHTEIGLIARQAREQGATFQIIGGDALVTDELWSIAGPAAEGLLMTFGPDPRTKPEAKDALAALQRAGYEPEGYTLYSYAAVQVLAEAMTRAKTPEKAAVALRQSPVKTVLGNLSFDAKGDVSGPTHVIYRWHDGKYAEIRE